MGKMLEGRVAVVTGSGRGIGRGIAEVMAEQGAKLVINDLGVGIGMDEYRPSSEAADTAVAEIKAMGREAVASYDSVATVAGARRIIQTAIDAFGRIDILVNNAGIGGSAFLPDLTEEAWDRMIAVHLKGTFACTQAAFPHMSAQSYGRVINISSQNATGTSRSSGEISDRLHYAAAKAGMLGFTWTLAPYAARFGITCNAIFPIATTRLTQADRERRAREGRPVSTYVYESREVGQVVAYLASEAGGAVNGQTIHAGGGHVTLYTKMTPARALIREGGFRPEELVDLVPKELLADN